MGSEENTSHSWVSFQSWLAQQRNGDGSPEANNSNDSMVPATNNLTNDSSSEDAHPQAPQPSRPQGGQSSSVSASLARDCRMETRLLDGSARGRQDMTIMLAAPGMPLHKSPLVTTRQATSLLSALCEPLVQVSVGRLTRRLESPTMLHTTQDRGVLSLWLLPNDDLSLVWQGRIKETTSSRSAPEVSSSSRETTSAAPTVGTAPVVHGEQCDSCDVSLWEELARFPSGAHPGSKDPVITIHMLRGDSTGRSFYIRPRIDAIAAQAEAVANNIQQSISSNPIGPVSAVDSFLESAFSNNSTAAAAAAAAASGGSSFDSAAGEGRRMYFWLTEPELAPAARNLGRLKSLVKRPPTLVKRSGVPQTQLNQIATWLQQLDIVAHQQQIAAISPAALPPAAVVEPPTAGSSSSSNNSSVVALLGHQGEPRGQSSRPTATRPVQQQESGRLAASGAVSATAAAVYRDRRFNISCPCAITVGASVSFSGNPAARTVAGTAAAAEELTGKAAQQAKQVAEDVARRTVERIGRRNLEEAICESLIRSVRAQRAKAKAQAQAQKERQSLQQQAEEAQPLIRKAVEHAVARGGTAPQSCKLQIALQVAAAAVAGVPDSAAGPLQVAGEHSGSGASDYSDGASAHSFANSPRRSTSETAVSTGDAAEGEDGESCATSTFAPDTLPPGTHQPHHHHPGGAQGRVTIDDLHTLLNTSGAARTAAATTTSSAGRTASGKVNISDLTELLESSRQPTSGER
ncbi:hypothetical protein Ndes2526B_g03307 [Nannochloris sp. 'desiccata']|nr:hypothetical protein KSW81_006477 [Chlorella desiccata (nom. nud.)]KAH7622478.1 hypothetical protein NADE_005063 [Chlorella desiccata (nom. nud.)]